MSKKTLSSSRLLFISFFTTSLSMLIVAMVILNCMRFTGRLDDLIPYVSLLTMLLTLLLLGYMMSGHIFLVGISRSLVFFTLLFILLMSAVLFNRYFRKQHLFHVQLQTYSASFAMILLTLSSLLSISSLLLLLSY